MLETLRQIEELASGLRMWTFASVGIAVGLAGLIIWLGGLRISRAIACLLGAAAGAIGGIFIAQSQGLIAIPIAATICGLLGLFLDKFMLVVIAMMIVTLGGLIFAVSPQLDQIIFDQRQLSNNISDGDILGVKGILLEAKNCVITYCQQVISALRTVSIKALIISVIAGVAVGVIGIFQSRLVVAAMCSSLGAMLIFAGMIIVLFFKGAEPITRISWKADLYRIVLVCMIVFGTCVQIMLCPAKIQKSKKTENTDGEE